jgi:cysteine synthase
MMQDLSVQSRRFLSAVDIDLKKRLFPTPVLSGSGSTGMISGIALFLRSAKREPGITVNHPDNGYA